MTMEYKSTPKRPYLLRAYYDWLLDNDLTPYLVVDALYQGVEVPIEYVKDGQIVLNLSPNAVGNLHLGNDNINFSARFQGVARHIVVPLGAALAIYARENGDGVMFEPESIYDEWNINNTIEQPKLTEKNTEEKAEKTPKSDIKKSTSHLRIIK